jgi:hypothetical protein
MEGQQPVAPWLDTASFSPCRGGRFRGVGHLGDVMGADVLVGGFLKPPEVSVREEEFRSLSGSWSSDSPSHWRMVRCSWAMDSTFRGIWTARNLLVEVAWGLDEGGFNRSWVFLGLGLRARLRLPAIPGQVHGPLRGQARRSNSSPPTRPTTRPKSSRRFGRGPRRRPPRPGVRPHRRLDPLTGFSSGRYVIPTVSLLASEPIASTCSWSVPVTSPSRSRTSRRSPGRSRRCRAPGW